MAFRLEFFKTAWNLFDVVLVAIWYTTEYMRLDTFLNPMILRLGRLARLMKVVRHVGWFRQFDSLHMLISAIRSSLMVLVWSALILISLLAVSALVAHGTLAGYLDDDHMPIDQRMNIFTHFGTFTRAFISMFEITFAGHAPVTRAVLENVGEGSAFALLVFKLIVSLSIMKVITGVFLHETFKVCSEDDELMIVQRQRVVNQHRKKMKRLFSNLNRDGDDALSWDEFEELMNDNWLRQWLQSMEIDTNHLRRLWALLDNGDGRLTADELILGVGRLKGSARSIDMLYNVHSVEAIQATLDDVHVSIKHMKHMQARGGHEGDLIHPQSLANMVKPSTPRIDQVRWC